MTDETKQEDIAAMKAKLAKIAETEHQANVKTFVDGYKELCERTGLMFEPRAMMLPGKPPVFSMDPVKLK